MILWGPPGTGKTTLARLVASETSAAFEQLSAVSAGVKDVRAVLQAARQRLEVDERRTILFLDEIHNLPERVQRSLLRVIEDGITTRIGDTAQRIANVRFVFASNAAPPTYSLAPDLLARLRTIRIPTLRERVADVPRIFDQLLERALAKHGLFAKMVMPLLGGDHYEAICLDGFEVDNVRGLIDVADRLATRILTGIPPQDAILTIFSERFQDGAVAARYETVEHDKRRSSHYEQNREIITAVFRECRGNLTATERVLGERGIKCTRRWLGIFAERWGLRAPRN